MQSIRTWAGIDVSAATLSARRWREGREETGTTLTLRRTGVEVMVVNPWIAKDFARALSTRSKTDAIDAGTLLEYVRRMEFIAWEAPSTAVLELREVGRRLGELVHVAVDEKNRLHARRTAAISKAVVADLEQHIEQLERRITAVETSAVRVIEGDDNLHELYRILVAAPGIARRTAILLLTELAVLDRNMTVRQIVAYAGLDPRQYDSGTSVHRQVRISKRGNARLRAILFMNALSAIRHDQGARRFYTRLVARGKQRMQAVVAVMRKLLHGIWIVLQRRIAFNSSILFAASLAQAESSDSAIAADQPQPEQTHPQSHSEAKELRQLDPAPTKATPHQRRKSKAA